MKVAIIGAGLAGLCCATELERLGVEYDMFERNHTTGEQYPHVGALLGMVDRPVKNTLKFLNKRYGISLHALAPLKKIIQYGPTTRSEVKGNLGFLLIRGHEVNSVKNQIARGINTKIQFNINADYSKLKQQYDYVVVANGRDNAARELGVWQLLFPGYIRGATVLGKFDPNTLIAWADRDFCKSGYAYLTPFSQERASLVLVVGEARREDMDKYWNIFMQKRKIDFEVVEYYEQEHYSGHVFPHKIDNVYLAGNSGGCVEPFLGFGQVFAMITGVEAARSIVYKDDYEKRLQPIVKRNLEFFEIRKAYNIFSNDGIDMMIQSLGILPINLFIYHSSADVIKYGAKMSKLAGKFTVKN